MSSPRKPSGSRRKLPNRKNCTICERNVSFCWSCSCGFMLCQECMDENLWGLTCNNVTWECPDCGSIRVY